MPSAAYIHDPTSVLNSSITVPTMWKSTTTRSSRRVSRRPATMATWISTAAIVRASLRASAASSGYQSFAASTTTKERGAEHARPRLLEHEHTELDRARPRTPRGRSREQAVGDRVDTRLDGGERLTFRHGGIVPHASERTLH